MPKYKNRITNNTIIPTNIGINSTGATYNLPEVTVTPQNNSRITKFSAKDIKDRETLIGNINKGQNEFADRFAKRVRNIADWLPVTGDILAGTDVYNATRQGNYSSAAALAGLMLVPNIIEKPIKIGKKLFKNINLNSNFLNYFDGRLNLKKSLDDAIDIDKTIINRNPKELTDDEKINWLIAKGGEDVIDFLKSGDYRNRLKNIYGDNDHLINEVINNQITNINKAKLLKFSKNNTTTAHGVAIPAKENDSFSYYVAVQPHTAKTSIGENPRAVSRHEHAHIGSNPHNIEGFSILPEEIKIHDAKLYPKISDDYDPISVQRSITNEELRANAINVVKSAKNANMDVMDYIDKFGKDDLQSLININTNPDAVRLKTYFEPESLKNYLDNFAEYSLPFGTGFYLYNQNKQKNMGGNSNLIRNGKPNVIRGGIARQFAPGLFYMNGRTHAAGGIDIGKNPRTGVEVEDGEVVQLNKNGMRVFSAMPFLTGESPASLVASGADPDVVFAAQENFKDRFGINDDGTMKAEYGLKVSTRGDEDNKYMTFKRMINTLGKLYYDAKVKAAKKNNVDEETISYYPSLETVQYIKGKEAFRPNIYRDGKGVPTIGYGTTQSTKAGKNAFKLYGKTGMTEEQASSVFNETVREMLPTFISATPNFNRLNDNQRNALFSYYYNVGHGGYTRKSPKLQQALKDFNLDEVVNQMDFGYYDTKNSGLRKRRDEERALFNMKSMGGIHIDKNKRGTFTAAATKHGMGVQEFASKVLANKENYSPAMVKKANFARNASRWKKPVGGVISINGNVKNGLVYTGRAKARFGDVYPIIRTKNGYITSGGYVPVNNKIDIYNGQQIEEPQYKIEGQGPVRSLVRGIPIKLDDGRGFYTITDRPAERVVGVRGFDNLMRVPNFIELENARTAINDWNNQDTPDFENYTPRNNRTVVVSRNAQPVVDTPVWDNIFNETVIGERPAVSPRTGRLSDNYSLTIPDRIIRGGEITPPDYRADITNRFIDGNFDGEVSKDRQPETDTTGGGFNLKDPAIIGAGINMLGTLGSYLINRNILNKARPRPTNVRLTAQKLKTRYNINPQLDELREQAAANNRLINNNTASSRTALGRMNLINTALGRSRAELYGNKENRETELINQDILNSQGVRNQEAIYNAQLRANYQDRLDDLNRLRLANNNALFSGLTGGVNSIIDSLLRQRYYNNTIGAIGARNPNVDARIFRDAGVDWSFMYPYSTRNRR